jgi:hypothetical protein
VNDAILSLMMPSCAYFLLVITVPYCNAPESRTSSVRFELSDVVPRTTLLANKMPELVAPVVESYNIMPWSILTEFPITLFIKKEAHCNF